MDGRTDGWRGKNAKATPLTGHEGPSGCEVSRIPHLLDSQLTDGDKVVSHTRRPPFGPPPGGGGDLWCSFLLEAESTPGPGRIRSVANPLTSGIESATFWLVA
jgi:hypothetical protein